MKWTDGWTGCLGLEPTIELYLKHLVGIFDEAKRVLRDDGVCFVNLGDTYSAQRWTSDSPQRMNKMKDLHRGIAPTKITDLPDKCLCLIPFRFAIEMVNHGWILRNTIIWSKPNPMPSSAKDRFTVDFEYVFFFSKKKKYWFEPQYETYQTESNAERPRMGQGQNTQYTQKRKEHKAGVRDWQDGINIRGKDAIIKVNPLGRNKRTTWTIPTEAFPEAHFATFPCALVEPMIKCGCPEFVCPKCGKARVKVYKFSGGTIGKSWHDHKDDIGSGIRQTSNGVPLSTAKGRKEKENPYQVNFEGYTSCSCGVGYEPGVVADFFCGSGTVGKVAAYLRRNYILIDAKKEYCRMAKERIAEPESGVPVKEQRQGQRSLFEREG